MQVTWIKCGDDGHWCSLEKLDLSSLGNTAGVYVIWHEGNPMQTVRVGQGDPIKDRLNEHQKDEEILAYNKIGTLRATCAAVSSNQRDGVEKYLVDILHPLMGERFPDRTPIAVNLPLD